jgi:hypothetical protein
VHTYTVEISKYIMKFGIDKNYIEDFFDVDKDLLVESEDLLHEIPTTCSETEIWIESEEETESLSNHDGKIPEAYMEATELVSRLQEFAKIKGDHEAMELLVNLEIL